MKKLLNTICKYILRFIITCRLHWPLAFFYCSQIKRVIPSNGAPRDPSKPTLLAITSHYFLKDLEILADTGEINIFKLLPKWQGILLRLYWTDKTWGGSEKDFRKTNKDYYQPQDQKMIKMQKKLRKAMGIFLETVFRIMKIDAVISANFTYRADYEYSIVTRNIGLPYIVFHKENLVLSKGLEEYWNIYMEDIGKFRGSMIILHNEKMKEIILKANFAAPAQLAVLGCLRMDSFINKVMKQDFFSEKAKFKRVTLFSFQKNAGLEMMYNEYFADKGFVKLFENYHVVFAQAAIAHPDIEFIIKPKYGKEWFKAIEKELNRSNIFLKDVPNLKMTVDKTAQELIFSSDFVISFQSTTILEAAFAGKPVIIPDFDEALKPEYQDYLVLKENYNLFDKAGSCEELRKLIEDRILDSSVSEEYIVKMRDFFDKHVSSLHANSTERYIKQVNEVIKSSLKKT